MVDGDAGHRAWIQRAETAKFVQNQPDLAREALRMFYMFVPSRSWRSYLLNLGNVLPKLPDEVS